MKKPIEKPEIPGGLIDIILYAYNNYELPVDLCNLEKISDERAVADQCSNLCMSVFMEKVIDVIATKYKLTTSNISTTVGHINFYAETDAGHCLFVDMYSDNISGTVFAVNVE